MSENQDAINEVVVLSGYYCPECRSPEIMVSSPRTHYKCGSSDYDGRDFVQSDKCKEICKTLNPENPIYHKQG